MLDAEPDIFEFWKAVGPTTKVHPADEPILVKAKHGLELNCLPNPFYGPLKTAPLVLLYLNPGLSSKDVDDAGNEKEQQFYWRQRQGFEPLRSQEKLIKKSWWVARTKRFHPDPEILRKKLAVLEICAYHSKSFNDAKLISRLPSSQAALSWAKTILFPEARARQRVVICFRGAKHWGLQVGQHEGFLFAPRVNMAGFMHANDDREMIVGTARKILETQSD